MSTPSKAVRSRREPRRIVAVLLFSVFLNFAGFTLIDPVAPELVGRCVAEGQVAAIAGLIIAAYAALEFVSAPAIGALSDRIGRRPVLFWSVAGSAVGYAVFGAGPSIWFLLAGRLISGVTAGSISSVYSCVGDIIPPQERGRIYGLLGAAGGAGFILGPVAGGLLGAISPTAPVFVAAAVAAANALWILAAIPETLPPQRRSARSGRLGLNPLASYCEALRVPGVPIAFAAASCFFFAATMMQSNIAVFTQQQLSFDPARIGLLLLVVGVMDVVTQGWVTPLLLRRMSPRMVAGWGLLLNAAGFGLIAIVRSPEGTLILAIGVGGLTLGDGLFQPPMTEIVSRLSGEHELGTLQGAYQGQQALARMIAPVVAGGLYMLDPGLPYWLGAAILISAIWLVRRIGSPISGRPPAPMPRA